MLRIRKIRRNNKVSTLKKASIFLGFIVLSATGNIALNYSTNGKPIEKYIFDNVTGKEELRADFTQEKMLLQEELQKIKAERDKLHQEKVSRGEMYRKEELKREAVIDAINQNIGGVLKGKGEHIYQVCKEYKVNPMLLTAIAKFETADGTSDLVVNANNPGGINWTSNSKYPKYGWYVEYPDLEVGIEKMAKLLKENYIDKGLGDIQSIAKKYCPVNDTRNGIAGMDNAKWPKFVTQYYIEIYRDAKKGGLS